MLLGLGLGRWRKFVSMALANSQAGEIMAHNAIPHPIPKVSLSLRFTIETDLDAFLSYHLHHLFDIHIQIIVLLSEKFKTISTDQHRIWLRQSKV